MIFSLAIQGGLFFKVMPVEEFRFHLGWVNFTATGSASNFGTSIIVYLIKNLCTASFYPKSFTVLRSRVRSDKMTSVQAKLVTSAAYVNEVAKIMKGKVKQARK